MNPRSTPARLYHYTCGHGARGIRLAGQIKPTTIYGTARKAVWLTDLDAPYREALGLTSHSLNCDRTAYRFIIDAPLGAIHWIDARRHLPRATVEALESAPGAMPMHWWLAPQPQNAVADSNARAQADLDADIEERVRLAAERFDAQSSRRRPARRR